MPQLVAIGRTYLARAATNLSPSRRAALEGFGLRRAVASGPLVVAEGPAKGLRLDGRHFPIAHVQAFGLVRGLLESPVQEALRRTVAPGSVVFDIRANLGFFSLLSARLTGSTGEVIAFEPLPEAADAVRANAAHNDFCQVRVCQQAVTSEEGRCEFLVQGEPSQSHVRARSPDGRGRSIVVDAVTLDGEVAAGRLPVPDVIKIDVEGSEIAVLAGAANLLREHRPVVICELHETNLEVEALLGAASYEIENLDGPKPIWVAGAAHVLARPATPTS